MPEMALNFVVRFVPMWRMAEMIVSAMMLAIKPYSIAVAPDSSARKRESVQVLMRLAICHTIRPFSPKV